MHASPTILFLAIGICNCGAVGQHTHPEAVSEDRLAQLAVDLSNVSYAVRTAATLDFYEIGPYARDLLRELAAGTDMEAALRARHILADLERLYFTGVEVTLAFSESNIQWDETVDLTVTLVNRSAHAALLPITLDPSVGEAASEDARQVGLMLDLSDWITVTNGKDQAITLRVDDISADPQVAAAVERRVETGSVAALPPGERMIVTLRAFNRGWARYRLLDKGDYAVVLQYAPQWKDPALTDRRVGFVDSNQTNIVIRNSAPPAVSRGHAEADLLVERDGPLLRARMTNRTDQPMVINTNFGIKLPFAQGIWVCSLGRTVHEIPIAKEFDGPAVGIDEHRLIEAKPGASVEIAQIRIDALRQALAEAGVNLTAGRWSVHFSYVNDWSRHARDSSPEAFQDVHRTSGALGKDLFRRVLSARHSSDRLIAP